MRAAKAAVLDCFCCTMLLTRPHLLALCLLLCSWHHLYPPLAFALSGSYECGHEHFAFVAVRFLLLLNWHWWKTIRTGWGMTHTGVGLSFLLLPLLRVFSGLSRALLCFCRIICRAYAVFKHKRIKRNVLAAASNLHLKVRLSCQGIAHNHDQMIVEVGAL